MKIEGKEANEVFLLFEHIVIARLRNALTKENNESNSLRKSYKIIHIFTRQAIRPVVIL
jgi:hypothetical protein